MHNITRHCASVMWAMEYNHGMTKIQTELPISMVIFAGPAKQTHNAKQGYVVISFSCGFVYVDPRYPSSCQVVTSSCLIVCVTCMDCFMHIKEYCQGILVDHGHLVRLVHNTMCCTTNINRFPCQQPLCKYIACKL